MMVSVDMEMVLTTWIANLGSVDLRDPLVSKSNLSADKDTKMAKEHAVPGVNANGDDWPPGHRLKGGVSESVLYS